AEEGVETIRTLRRTICSGEELPPDVARRFFQRLPGELHNLYGPTEAAIDVTAWQCTPEAATVPIGRPIQNTRLYVLDPAGNPTPVGVPGELHIGGAGVALGYLNRPELTAERLVPEALPLSPSGKRDRTAVPAPEYGRTAVLGRRARRAAYRHRTPGRQDLAGGVGRRDARHRRRLLRPRRALPAGHPGDRPSSPRHQ